MKLLIDEDTQANLLVAQLKAAGHDVCTVGEAGLNEDDDPVVLDYARQTGRMVLTKNCNDFKDLHDQGPPHPGILAIYQYNNPKKDMSYAAIIKALANLEASGWDFRGEFIKVNDWNY